jgi:hypothetical protein
MEPMKSETRYPLLVYREWMRPIRIPAFGLTLCLLAAWLASMASVFRDAPPWTEILLGAAFGAAFLLWLAAVILPRTTFVTCRPEYVLIRIGLLRLAVSYARVRIARTVLHGQIHPPKEEPRSLRRLAMRLAPRHSVALELTSYPTAFFLLRALTHPFFFLGQEPGFLFAVEDWMGLGRELEQGRAAWLEKRRDSGRHRRIVEDLL